MEHRVEFDVAAFIYFEGGVGMRSKTMNTVVLVEDVQLHQQRFIFLFSPA